LSYFLNFLTPPIVSDLGTPAQNVVSPYEFGIAKYASTSKLVEPGAPKRPCPTGFA
jgi:hypothetical protein